MFPPPLRSFRRPNPAPDRRVRVWRGAVSRSDMSNITASLVKDLRDKTGAGMMDCKNALAETNGDLEAAVDWLRKKGLAKAAKKAGRVAAEGMIGIAVGYDSGALV